MSTFNDSSSFDATLDEVNRTVCKSVEQLKSMYSAYNKQLVTLQTQQSTLESTSKNVAASKQLLQRQNEELQKNRDQLDDKWQQLHRAKEAVKEREDKVKTAENNIDLAERRLEEKEKELKEKEDHILSLEKRLNTTIIPSTEQVRLNIGGKKYHTSIDTLTAEKNTFFSGMLSGSYKRNKNGEYFIDRDGTLFYIILNHLRGYDTDQTIYDLGFTRKQRLVEDLEFYGIGHWLCETCDSLHLSSPPPDLKCCYSWLCTYGNHTDEGKDTPAPKDYVCSDCVYNLNSTYGEYYWSWRDGKLTTTERDGYNDYW